MVPLAGSRFEKQPNPATGSNAITSKIIDLLSGASGKGSLEAQVPPFPASCFWTFAHVSRNVTVRLNISFSEVRSFESATK